MEDIKTFAVKLSAATDHFEERSSRVVETNHHAAQQLLHAAQQVSSTVERSTTQAMSNVKTATHAALTEGLAGPVHNLEETLQRSARTLEVASQHLAGRIEAMRRMHTTHAWRAFIACAIGSLLAIGASLYAVRQAREEIARARWVSEINAAVDKGNLTVCQDGGVCARLGNKWVRLDK
ncbi:hypothetical protein [Dyella nitratireducens]|uniref:Relaxation protein n=1 Tax=Dyella nitratireducens TaxID=1849580 RepID=A0ABQ1FIU9_9GAMM|nr:hypothetical protein [Dyella nitratireducens]GGA16676.1 hypothetical protein GCM10010981_00410 [Dyella nitratireducens]GLQ44899.1 hypothetical protein GCM10007902_47490 [Dyella nitratireducens]